MLTTSVIIPTYNRAHLVGRAIDSVLCQLQQGDEIVVVDDGSMDDTEAAVRRFEGPIRYIRTANGGAGAARNRGIREAKGNLIGFLDSDDEWLPGKLSIQRRLMEADSELLFCFSDFRVKTRSGKIIPNALPTWHRDARPWSEILGPGRSAREFLDQPDDETDFMYYAGSIYRDQLQANYISTNTLMVRRAQAGDSLRYAEDTSTYEDWECHGRLARRGICAYLETETVLQHGHEGPRLTDANVAICAESRAIIVRRVWGEDPEFLKNNRELYEQILDKQLGILARHEIIVGSKSKGRAAMREMSKAPASLKLLAVIPSPLLRSALRMRRRLLGKN